jgi:peptidylprolyl isomerase
MGNPRAVISAIAATILLIVGLGVWVGYRNGDLSFSRGERIEDHEFPKALDEADTQTSTNTSQSEQSTTTPMTNDIKNQETNKDNPTVTFKTSDGDIVLELYQDVMPITVANFLSLAKKDFYDGTKFHRVINGFMIQGGDPNSKTAATETYGRGGPGYAIEDEFIKNDKLSNIRGTIAMANSGPNSGGSQFFINLVDNTGLDFDKPPDASSHPVFGKVISGMAVVDTIAKVPTNNNDLPLEPVVIMDVVVGE